MADQARDVIWWAGQHRWYIESTCRSAHIFPTVIGYHLAIKLHLRLNWLTTLKQWLWHFNSTVFMEVTIYVVPLVSLWILINISPLKWLQFRLLLVFNKRPFSTQLKRSHINCSARTCGGMHKRDDYIQVLSQPRSTAEKRRFVRFWAKRRSSNKLRILNVKRHKLRHHRHSLYWLQH